MIRYYKLFDLLNRRNMKKTDLLEVISAPTLAKISKGKNIQTDSIDKICLLLNCQPADIMEVFDEEIDTEDGSLTYVKPITNAYEVDDKIIEEKDIDVGSRVVDEDKHNEFIDKLKKSVK